MNLPPLSDSVSSPLPTSLPTSVATGSFAEATSMLQTMDPVMVKLDRMLTQIIESNSALRTKIGEVNSKLEVMKDIQTDHEN